MVTPWTSYASRQVLSLEKRTRIASLWPAWASIISSLPAHFTGTLSADTERRSDHAFAPASPDRFVWLCEGAMCADVGRERARGSAAPRFLWRRCSATQQSRSGEDRICLWRRSRLAPLLRMRFRGGATHEMDQMVDRRAQPRRALPRHR